MVVRGSCGPWCVLQEELQGCYMYADPSKCRWKPNGGIMGHHVDENGDFQSDKHSWLPKNTILINPYRLQSEKAMLRWSDAGDWCIQLPDENATYPKTRIVVFFEDAGNVPMLLAVADAYAEDEPELSEDIRTVLARLHPDQF